MCRWAHPQSQDDSCGGQAHPQSQDDSCGGQARPQSQDDSCGEQGFTLVELIVTITIIVMITALGMVSFAGVNKRSRDSRRVADLKKVSIALEIYRQEVGNYPDDKDDLVDEGYLEALPLDPKNPTYLYDLNIGEEYSYELYAHMEDSGSTTGTYAGSCGEGCNYRTVSP